MTKELEEDILNELLKIYPKIEVYNPKDDSYPYFIKIKGLGMISGNTRLNALINTIYIIEEERHGSKGQKRK